MPLTLGTCRRKAFHEKNAVRPLLTNKRMWEKPTTQVRPVARKSYFEIEMKIDIPDEDVPPIVRALEHCHAYTCSVQREDFRYQTAADWFKRKQAGREEGETTATKRKRA
jgi:hypothetical protein